MASWADRMQNDVGVQRHLVEQNEEFAGEKIRNLRTDLQTLGEDFELKLQSMSKDVAVLKKAIL